MRNQKGRLAVISEHACNWNRLDSPCRKLIGDPGASERAYRTRVVANRQKALNMMKVLHDRLKRNADVSNRDPLPKAQQTRQTVNLQLCCEFNSWQICGACNSAQRSHTCGHAQDSVAMGEQVNLHLLPQGLTRSILEAICPVQANFGPLLESKDQFGRGNGYRFHSSMVTFSWHCRSIEDRVAGLFPAERIVAEAALEWLRENSGPEQEQSAFGELRQEHEWLPEKHPRPDDKAAKRWLRYIEKESLECALWPHLFTQRKQCLTWARLQSTTRQAKAAHRSTLAERLDAPLLEEDEEAEPPADVVGVKRHYMALLFSPILDVGLSYEILHFSYDLNLWSDLGSKRNLQLGLPMRLMLKNHSFSSEYWKDMQGSCSIMVKVLDFRLEGWRIKSWWHTLCASKRVCQSVVFLVSCSLPFTITPRAQLVRVVARPGFRSPSLSIYRFWDWTQSNVRKETIFSELEKLFFWKASAFFKLLGKTMFQVPKSIHI